MPTYDYACPACGGFEALRSLSQRDEPCSCPDCGTASTRVFVAAPRLACLNAIEYLKKFGYSGAQAYSILGTAPVQGHISGVVDIPNACATLWIPTGIFDFDINPSAAGPTKFLDGSIDMPISPDLK